MKMNQTENPTGAACTAMPQSPPPLAPGVCDGLLISEPLEHYRAKDLRREVYRLKLKVIRQGDEMNDHKHGYIALLRRYIHEKAAMAEPDASENLMCREMLTEANASYVPSLHDLQPIDTLISHHPSEQGPKRYVSDGEEDACVVSDTQHTQETHENQAVCIQDTSDSYDMENEDEDATSFQRTARYTRYWEGRLHLSKRKMCELRRDLERPCDRVEGNLLKDELVYYVRERKRALRSLLSEQGNLR